ncbi:restriction endonuclease subunit S, partial [Chryseobacterium sp. MHB01]|uniref:restriction endonuclease subunit S n=1 Tax=Chryseobacterium sp. MHB01 TaxID=3109433 RepID=UPI002AFE3C67
EVKKLGEVANIGRGKSKHRPRDAEFLFGGKYPFVQTGDVRKAGLYLTEFTQTYSEAGLLQSKLWNEDTLCITIAANIAETSILKIKACFPDSIIGLIPKENKTIVLFVKYLFDKFKIEIQNLSQGAAQDNLNQDKLSKIEFTFPHIEEQKKISSFIFSIDSRIQTQ